jgi:hypothetical protein
MGSRSNSTTHIGIRSSNLHILAKSSNTHALIEDAKTPALIEKKADMWWWSQKIARERGQIDMHTVT